MNDLKLFMERNKWVFFSINVELCLSFCKSRKVGDKFDLKCSSYKWRFMNKEKYEKLIFSK